MENPHHLFLLDGIGAIASAVSLGMLLPYFQEHIGMPLPILYTLAVPAVLFAVYSLSCYLFRVERWRLFLRYIAVANLLYCFVTIFLMFSNFRTLTGWGLAYFVGEILVILMIVGWELKLAGKPE